ncbi:MAG: nickel pincer cofactor biosynthesis protein LarB [Bacillota bacterium]|nr:nickel pincer cofactor biosynthesis protein LarB [Bacillota bacterium]
MNHRQLREILEQVAAGALPVEEAGRRLEDLPYEDLGFARLDHHRELRQGFPEVVFCGGKTPAQVALIFERLARRSDVVLATRATPEAFAAVRRVVPAARYEPAARCIVRGGSSPRPASRPALLVSAGTADLPVAEEARVCLEALGHPVTTLYDVGVSGLHRLLGHLELIRTSPVIIVVAGLEGALPSVVAGLTARPVIAVPTSVGYGASLGGLDALLAMLNGCAPGVAVVNIDNGYGAAALASAILRTTEDADKEDGN